MVLRPDSERASRPPDTVNFYHEYIARHSPLSLSWLQVPFEPQRKHRHEIRGLGVTGHLGETIVAPLDDDSVCLWSVGRDDDITDKAHGRILGQSKAGILATNKRQHHPLDYETLWRETVVECVSVDQLRSRAYFAVGDGLSEIDLETLQLVSSQKYSSAVCALSKIHLDPLTIATTTSLYIHDPRSPRYDPSETAATGCLDHIPMSPTGPSDFNRLLSVDTPYGHAPLINSPLSIVNLHTSQTIHVAGRFPSILTFDRRTFPKIKIHSTIHSGARLSSLTSTSVLGTDTLIACGEYNGKGSLELYHSFTSSFSPLPSHLSAYRNRTSAARSKLLSVASHGNRIVFCDGDGMLKWVENDGSTLVRRWNINSFTEHETARGVFGGPSAVADSDVARKIVPLNDSSKSELAIWTGERIGIVGFGKKPRFGTNFGGDEIKKDGDEIERNKKEHEVYEARMRRALERQADEVRFVQGLGLGI